MTKERDSLNIEREKLNRLAASYQEGNKEARDELFRKITPIIEKASSELERFTNNYTEFDCRILLKVKKLVETFDRRRERNFIGIVKTLVDREKTDFIRRRSRRLEEVSIDAMENPDGEEDLGFQFEDPLARVEEQVLDEELVKEKIALLAKDDPRRKTVLIEWSKGTNNTTISDLLAQIYGGKAETHRKFITRFRTDCQKALFDEELSARRVTT